MEVPVIWTLTPACLSVSKSLLNGGKKKKMIFSIHSWFYSNTDSVLLKGWLLKQGLKKREENIKGYIFLASRTLQDKCLLLEEKKNLSKLWHDLMSLFIGLEAAGGWVHVHHPVQRDTSLWLLVLKQLKNWFQTSSEPAILNISHFFSLQFKAYAWSLWLSSADFFFPFCLSKKTQKKNNKFCIIGSAHHKTQKLVPDKSLSGTPEGIKITHFLKKNTFSAIITFIAVLKLCPRRKLEIHFKSHLSIFLNAHCPL